MACAATVFLLAADALAAQTVSSQAIPEAKPTPFEGQGMWIWQVSRSSRGSVDAIAARAARSGITTLFVKAAHGHAYWPQFSPRLVAALRARGLKVCGYQRLVGRRPRSEAARAVRAVRFGADCFVIDAEAEYYGKQRQARTYLRALRARIGRSYPLGFTSFPYVSLHRRLPYRVFLGRGGAQYNLPQMYWRAIGTSVSAIYARTYRENRVFGRPIYPLGQLYGQPPIAEICRFGELARAYGARGLSWWSWQSAGRRGFRAIAPAGGSMSGLCP